MDERPLQEMDRRLDGLARANRRLRCAVAALVVVAVAPWLSGLLRPHAAEARQAEPEADRPRDPSELVRDRLELSRKALDMIARSTALGGPVVHQVSDIYVWSCRLLGSQIYLGMAEGETRVEDPEVYLGLTNIKPSPGRIAAFEEHLARMRSWEDRLRPLAESRTLSPLNFLEIQSHRVQAQLWLRREQLR